MSGMKRKNLADHFVFSGMVRSVGLDKDILLRSLRVSRKTYYRWRSRRNRVRRWLSLDPDWALWFSKLRGFIAGIYTMDKPDYNSVPKMKRAWVGAATSRYRMSGRIISVY
jgi:hypothetical protein